MYKCCTNNTFLRLKNAVKKNEKKKTENFFQAKYSFIKKHIFLKLLKVIIYLFEYHIGTFRNIKNEKSNGQMINPSVF